MTTQYKQYIYKNGEWKLLGGGDNTDTHYEAKLVTANAASSTTQVSQVLSNGDVYLNLVENNVVRSSHKISGSGTSSVTTDASGNILIGSSGGAVTSITAGTGLSGGTITNNGTISANLNSTTSLGTLGTTSKLYAIGVDSNGKLSVNIPWTDTTYTFAEGSVDGAFSVNNTSVSIHGLGDRAFDSTTYIPTSSRAAANGVAPLNASSKIDATYLPSYVDDVLEYSAQSSFPTTGTSGIIYVDTSDGKIYRWSGSQYINISADTNTTYTFASGSTSGTFTVTASNNPSNPQTITVGDTWIANDATHSGYVAATGGSTNAGKVWKVGNTGTPGWFNDTDTHYEAKLITADSASSTTQTTSTLSNGNVYLNLIENGTKRSGHKISGSGDTTVTTDASGNIIISSTSGTNTAITVGTGLSTNVSGGIITGAGTISANLNSTTSLGTLGTTDKLYAVGVDANGKLSVNVPWSNTHNTTYLYAGDTGATANATSTQANPYLALVDGGSNTSNVQLYAGANVSISAINGVVTFSSTWKANDATNEGYVAATGGSTNKGKVWKISSNGTPTWLEESTSIYVRANPSYTTNITGTAAIDPYLVLNNTISNTSSVQIASGNNVTVSGLGDIITINSLDEKVTQTASNTNATYEVLFSGSANNNTATEGVKKYSNLTFNPSTGMFTTSKATITNLSLSGTGTSVSMASGGTVTGFPTITVLTGASVPASGQNPDHVATITYSAGVLSFTSKKFTTGQALYNNGVVQ